MLIDKEWLNGVSLFALHSCLGWALLLESEPINLPGLE